MVLAYEQYLQLQLFLAGLFSFVWQICPEGDVKPKGDDAAMNS